MGVLGREQILKADDVTTEEVAVPEWGGSVLVRGLTGRQRDEFEAALIERRGKRAVPNTDNIRAKLVARCCVDEAGQRLFTDADAGELGNRSGAALDRVYEVAARLSGIGDEDLEELTEDFGSPSGVSSSSGSPSGSAGPSASYSTEPTAES
jgi:hypothetical protein